MNAPELLARITAAGLTVEAAGQNLLVRPANLLTPELRDAIREHKSELLDAITPDRAVEARRQRVLAMLAERPEARYALLTDTTADPEAVIVALAIRGRATCELHIPRDRYDPFLLLHLIERHGATVH